jgi:hypothetical protein
MVPGNSVGHWPAGLQDGHSIDIAKGFGDFLRQLHQLIVLRFIFHELCPNPFRSPRKLGNLLPIPVIMTLPSPKIALH